MIQHIAFYKFVAIEDLDAVLAAVRQAACDLTGSVLMAKEGINGTLAGPGRLLDCFETTLATDPLLAPLFADMVYKRTDCKTPPFGRLKVARKRDIVEMGLPHVDAARPAGVLLDPAQWKDFMARDDVVIIDNRNSFEYRLGHFNGALDPGVQHFRDFPAYMETHLAQWQAQGKTIGMYCTGGIRCEKTAAWLAHKGVEVVQLKGGILSYFKDMPDAHRQWRGECFVFDNRIALDTRLQETGRTLESVYEAQPDGPWRIARAQRLKASVRNGVAPSVVLCPPGPWPTFHAFLVERFPIVGEQDWARRLQAGEVADTAGHVIGLHDVYQAQVRLVYYRAMESEPPVPFEARVLFANERFLVADKPHFLPVAPSGRYVTQTLLVRLRQQLGLDDLMPAHRIDRETAGLVLLTVDSRFRDAYQALFRRRRVHKTYEAVAAHAPHLQWPCHLEQHIEQSSHFMQMQVSPEGGKPANAVVDIDQVQVVGESALYRLTPLTGVRHQLRVQMASLGLPLRNDQIYPVLQAESAVEQIAGTYAAPLQLLARELSFDDPVTGERFSFQSERCLQWPPASAGAD
jgi:UPF0176 protein